MHEAREVGIGIDGRIEETVTTATNAPSIVKGLNGCKGMRHFPSELELALIVLLRLISQHVVATPHHGRVI